MKSIPRQKFTPEFRLEAVKLVLEQGIQTADAARRLGMSGKTLSHWVLSAKEGQLKKIDAKRKEPVSTLEAEFEVSSKFRPPSSGFHAASFS